MRTYIPGPPVGSPLSSIQGLVAYGDGQDNTVTNITFSFQQRNGTQAWTEAYKQEFRAALAVFEAVANIKFTEINSPSADLVEYISPSSFFDNPGVLGYHYTPGDGPSEGNFNTGFWRAGAQSNGDPGGFFFTTIVHEIGHALGLAHPHDTGLGTTVMSGVTSSFGSFGDANLNQGVYTVMSYNDGWTQQNGLLPVSANHGASRSLGTLDIAALQNMYGANTTANSGNNTYVLSAANVAGVGYEAIWDTGGTDMIAHNGSQSAIIDLRAATLDYTNTGAGVVSHAAGVKGGFTIAHGVVIENASGGSGDDTIHGNDAVNDLRGHNGNDTIHSASDGTNNNTIYGGYGNDTIYVANGRGADTVLGDFDNDTAIVTSNAGIFYGGSGFDTVRFVSAISNYLFLNNGTTYQFFNLITRVTFSVSNDVEQFQFANGALQYSAPGLAPAMAVQDIETNGTVLQYASQGAYLLDGGTLNIGLMYEGRIVGNQTFEGWQAIQAQAYNGGYRVLWKNIDGRLTDWTVNAQGRFESNAGVTNVVDVESLFGVDLNSDGTIGHTTRTIETDGSTNLSASTHGYYLIGASTRIKFNGEDVGPDTFPGWQAIHAEAKDGGFVVLWKSGPDQYSVWTLNGSGQYQSHVSVDNIVDHELQFNFDFNSDGTIGHTTRTIEANGATSLSASTEGHYVIGASTRIVYNEQEVGPDTFPGWQAVHAEAKDDKFIVLWKSGSGQYSVWTLNGTEEPGKYESHVAVDNIVDQELQFGVDLNSDGTIGHTTRTIETDGETNLSASTHGYYLIGASTRIKFNGEDVGPNTFPGWQAIHAEAKDGGFVVLWKSGPDQYSVWTLNGSGQYQSHVSVDNIEKTELLFDGDLDNNGTIGYVPTSIESAGSTTLSTGNQGTYLLGGSKEFEFNGANVGPDSFTGWSAIHAEETANGYRVLWKGVAGNYVEWTLDSDGQYVSHTAIENVETVENFYGADIDENGLTGPAPTKEAPKALLAIVEGSDEFEFHTQPRDRQIQPDQLEELNIGRTPAIAEAIEAGPKGGTPDGVFEVVIEPLLSDLLQEDSFWL
ncbi:matrixin family metalloprotease [Ruegeria sp. R14_0]|uniref:matrixin family metalloprotease n=1 Tax=Ruegeria sp. R14_0 TaxID=2821100 RepID=UPI001AD991B2|nr:matrixin family metalloprotease [Ruegeria sp. R14_0]MBO9445978.1 matrixin family metalloprotease [Ruegeria sp. R14_0]